MRTMRYGTCSCESQPLALQRVKAVAEGHHHELGVEVEPGNGVADGPRHVATHVAEGLCTGVEGPRAWLEVLGNVMCSRLSLDSPTRRRRAPPATPPPPPVTPPPAPAPAPPRGTASYLHSDRMSGKCHT